MKIPRRLSTDLWLLKHALLDLPLAARARFAFPAKEAMAPFFKRLTTFKRLMEVAVAFVFTTLVALATVALPFAVVGFVFYLAGSVAIAIAPSLATAPLAAIAPTSPSACAKMETLLLQEQAALKNDASFPRAPGARQSSLYSWIPTGSGNVERKAVFCHRDSQGSFVMLASQHGTPLFPSARAATLLRLAGAEGSEFKLTENPPPSVALFLEFTGIVAPTEVSRSMWLAGGGSGRDALQLFEPQRGFFGRALWAFQHHPWVAFIGFIVFVITAVSLVVANVSFVCLHAILCAYDWRSLIVELRQSTRRVLADRSWASRFARRLVGASPALARGLGLALIFCSLSLFFGIFVSTALSGEAKSMWTSVSSEKCSSMAALKLPIAAANGDIIHASCRAEADGSILVATLAARSPHASDSWKDHLEMLVPGARWREAELPKISQWGAVAAELFEWRSATSLSRLVAHRAHFDSSSIFSSSRSLFFTGAAVLLILCGGMAMIFCAGKYCASAVKALGLAALTALRSNASNSEFLSRAELRELDRASSSKRKSAAGSAENPRTRGPRRL